VSAVTEVDEMATDRSRDDAPANEPAGQAGADPDAALLGEARRLLPPLGEVGPRPGFALRVAIRAQEEGARAGWRGLPQRLWPAGVWQRRAGLGLVGLAAAAALLLAVRTPAPSAGLQGPVLPAAVDQLAFAGGGALQVAQRLELYEELSLAENAEALEELEVVAALHRLPPRLLPAEGKP
jgi:hypothetical protein